MSILGSLQERASEMVDALRALVEAESPTSDPGACSKCLSVAQEIAADLFSGSGERVESDDREHLVWRFADAPRVVLLGHLDTVWPVGTVERWPFAVEDDRATGPGAFDMKAGVVQSLFALASLDDLDGVAVVLTTDEEIGSPTARGLIEETVAGAEAVLVAEPSADGALKTQRKGTSTYRVHVTGRASHAGLDPENGVSAAIELAHQILAIAELADPVRGTTVAPNVVSAGTTTNTIPGTAAVDVDVRAATKAEQERVEAGLNALEPVLPDASLRVERKAFSPPLERSMSAGLFARARELQVELGLAPLTEAAVGGGSDGNFTASLGIPTLDGLGAVGGNAHAEGEFVQVSAMPERAALVALLVDDLREGRE